MIAKQGNEKKSINHGQTVRSPKAMTNPFRPTVVAPVSNYTIIQDQFVEIIAPNQRAERTGNYTKFFYADKVKEIENQMSSRKQPGGLMPTHGLNQDLSQVNSSKLDTGAMLTLSSPKQDTKEMTLVEYIMQEQRKLNDKNNKQVIFQNLEPFKLKISKAQVV